MSGLEGDGWIYMTDMWNDSEIIDSVEYHDGAFRFEVCADEPTKVFLHAGCFRAFTLHVTGQMMINIQKVLILNVFCIFASIKR